MNQATRVYVWMTVSLVNHSGIVILLKLQSLAFAKIAVAHCDSANPRLHEVLSIEHPILLDVGLRTPFNTQIPIIVPSLRAKVSWLHSTTPYSTFFKLTLL